MENPGIKQDAENERNCLFDQLESENSWLKQFLNILPVGVIITDPEGMSLMTNAEADRINKHKFLPSSNIEEYVGWRLLYKGGRPIEHEDFPLYRIFHKGEVVNGEEQRILHDDGTTTPVSVTAAPIRDSQGRITNAIIVLTDITDKERCENALLGVSREQRWR